MLKSNAFVLRRQDFRETDRIYTVYTDEFGKMSLLARGARKIKSKLAPHLEAFSEVRVNFAKGKIFTHLSGAMVLKNYNLVLKDMGKMELVGHCLNLLDKFVKYDDADAEIYKLLESVAAIANEAKDDDFAKIRVYFFWRLVDLLGYRPQLDECALCGKISTRQSAGQIKFNVTDNIVICGECTGGGMFIKNETLENLKNVFETTPEEFVRGNLDSMLLTITEKAKQIKLSEL